MARCTRCGKPAQFPYSLCSECIDLSDEERRRPVAAMDRDAAEGTPPEETRPALDKVPAAQPALGTRTEVPQWDQVGPLETRAWATVRDLRGFALFYITLGIGGALIFGYLGYRELTSDVPSGDAGAIFFALAATVLLGNLIGASILRGLALIVEATARATVKGGIAA